MLARRRITLPLPVIRNRFAVPLCVFIFGMVAVVSIFMCASRHDCHARSGHAVMGVPVPLKARRAARCPGQAPA